MSFFFPRINREICGKLWEKRIEGRKTNEVPESEAEMERNGWKTAGGVN